MTVSESVVALPAAPADRFVSAGPEHCLAQRADGVHADLTVLGTTTLAAVDAMLRAGSVFVGLDYPVLIKALYGAGPALPAAPDGGTCVRLAQEVRPFEPRRRCLYRSVKIIDGQAEYCFEPVFLAGPEGEELPTSLDIDEFVADMWSKGIRFGIDIDAVKAAIANPGAGRVVIARRLEPEPGEDAQVVEVSDDIHRSNAPRQLANGKLDLMSFQNRFPQMEAGTCLLQKLPPRPGTPGFELSGIRIEPPVPCELDFSVYAGAGTRIEPSRSGDYLIATRTGFLNVDPKSQQVSIDDKVISHDGVSARTTGNLQLSGDYEEFGEVQEKRVIEGNSITVHADVYGEIVSRGGSVRLCANLVGGSAHNKHGDIRIDGVAASAVIQAEGGTVTLARAENCVISGSCIRIEQAVNCEIVGDEVTIGLAEGCAVAGLRVAIESTAPWRDSEMLVYLLCADCGRIDAALEALSARLLDAESALACCKQEQTQLCAQPALRHYLEIAGRVRSGETTLTAVQSQQLRQVAQAVGPQLARIGELGAARKAAEAEMLEGQAQLASLVAERAERSAGASAAEVVLQLIQGETTVRQLVFDPDGSALRLAPAREIRLRLRGSEGLRLHEATRGSYRWRSDDAPACS